MLRSSLKLLTIVCVIIILGLSPAFAQENDSKFTIYGCVSMPTGDFGDKGGEGEAGAETGFGGGIDFLIPLNTPGLSAVINGSFLYNSMDESWAKEILYSEFNLPEDVSLDIGAYINIPILAGLKYQSQTSETMDLYGIGLIGLNILMPPKMELSSEEGNAELKFDTATSFGFGIGGGVVFNKKFNIGFRYLSLGEPELKGEVTYPGGSEKLDETEGKVSVILILVGINL